MWKVIGSRHNKSICSISSVLCVQKLFRDAGAHYLHSTLWPEVFSCVFLHKKDIGPHSHRYPSTYLTLSIGKDELPELRTAVEVLREMLYLQSHPTYPAMGGNNLGSVSTPSLAVRIEKLVLALFLVCTVTLTNHRPLHASVALTIKSKPFPHMNTANLKLISVRKFLEAPMHDAIQIKWLNLFLMIPSLRFLSTYAVDTSTISSMLTGDNI